MSLRKQAISGAFWNAISYGSQAIVQVLRLSILTRFLDKSDFGLVAIVVLILGFTRIFADLGVSTALFSRSNISKKEYSSLYWVALLLSGLLYLLLILSTPLIVSFYDLQVLGDLIPILALDLIISTAGRQFRVFRQKSLKFRSLALIDICSSAVSLITAVYFAYVGLGVYSLIYSTLLASLLSTVSLIVSGIKNHPIAIYINIKENRSFYVIGLYQTGSQILDYFASQLDVLLMSKIVPLSDLGVYNLLKQLVVRLYGFLNSVFTNVSIPILAKLKDSIINLRDNYLLLLNLTATVNTVIFALVALLAYPVLLMVYGSQYVQHEMLLRMICIWGVFISITSISSMIVVVTGKTNLGFKWTVFRIAYNPPFLIIGSMWGLEGILVGQVLYAFTLLPLYWFVLIRKALPSVDFYRFMKSTFFPVFSACLLALMISMVTLYYFAHFPQIIVAVFSVFAFSCLFFISNRKNIHLLMDFLPNFRK